MSIEKLILTDFSLRSCKYATSLSFMPMFHLLYKAVFSKIIPSKFTTYNINFAIWAYKYGPNFIHNESLPKRYLTGIFSLYDW